jgi:CDP-paratose 2-epimerase
VKYLITGGCGFLGSNVAAALLRQGATVLVLDNLSRLGSIENLQWLRSQGDLQFKPVDVRNAHDVAAQIGAYQPDRIFHLAGQVAMTTSVADPRLDFEVNALGSFNVLEAVRLHCPQAVVVYSSTNKVYGDLETVVHEEAQTRYVVPDYPHGLPESLPLDFHSPYGCSKGSADQYMRDFHRMFGLKTVVLRHSSMYGGRQFASFDQGWVGWFSEQAVRQSRGEKNSFSISGNGKQVRDLLHADDAVRLYLGVADAAEAIAGRAFNVGGGMANSLSILELLQRLEQMTGHPLAFHHIAPRSSDQRFFVADNRTVGELTGWAPKIDVAKGLALMLDWAASTLDSSERRLGIEATRSV